MSDNTPTRKRELFEAVVDLPVEERSGFLDRQCPDPEVRGAVERLLRLDESSGGEYLSSPIVRPETTVDDAPLPETIGRYRITARIGTGGMGVVYKGAQESPRRAVAIKVVRAEMISRRMLSRFRNEAEILGRLDHPGIARIYEAGTARMNGGGERPFFAMELVRGTPLIEYAGDRDTAERLRLFADVADAVHHAHQKGVIHRDLKPANVLVTDDGQVKVLDFGIARATDADIQAVTVQTDVGQLLGTVPYMSPEQVAGDIDRVDTRSDVYALGVVLFELLAGTLPHDVRERSVVDAARIIHDDEPTRLSTVVPALRGDLEWIAAKALEKDIDRRYDSASALAADVRRHLADEPVLAGPPSASYRLRKFIRRNKAGVAWAAAVALLLTVGVATTIALAVRATHAETAALAAGERSQREADHGRLRADFLVWALASGSLENTEAVRSALDVAEETIDERFGNNSIEEASVRRLLGDVYHQIGAYGAAREQLVVAHEIIRESGDPQSHLEALQEILNLLQSCERELGNGERKAIAWALENLDVMEEVIEQHDAALADAVRTMRRDLNIRLAPDPDDAPTRALQDASLENVMAIYRRRPRPENVGRSVARYLLYMGGYMGNSYGVFNISYHRAQIEILETIEGPRARRHLGITLWIDVRSPAAPGEEDRRVRMARRLVDEHFGHVGWWLHDFESLLGDALVQRGHDDDQEEIVERLTAGGRGVRELATRDADVHPLLAKRLGSVVRRLAAVGHDDRVVHLVDQPPILDELALGVDALVIPAILDRIAVSMQSREGRSDRWYAVARQAADRAQALAAVAPAPS